MKSFDLQINAFHISELDALMHLYLTRQIFREKNNKNDISRNVSEKRQETKYRKLWQKVTIMFKVVEKTVSSVKALVLYGSLDASN